MSRLTINPDTASDVAEALAYYLTASSNNFGAGWEGADPDEVVEARRARRSVTSFCARLDAITEGAPS